MVRTFRHQDQWDKLRPANNQIVASRLLRAGRHANWTSGLPDTWCGKPGTRNDTAHQLHPNSVPQIHVVYAYPKDTGNQISSSADMIQQMVRQTVEWVAQESDRKLSIRFDLGTTCGPNYVDIKLLPLRHKASVYHNNPDKLFEMVWEDLADKRKSMGIPDDHNVVIMVDDAMNIGDQETWTAGEAEILDDDEPSPALNLNSRGGLTAMVYGDRDHSNGTVFFQGYSIMLHEITHTLGAVLDGAPNASGYGHCGDEWDLMCYEDHDGYETWVACSDYSWDDEREAMDCNKDDYFNPNPKPGSYLATHWNTANSVFMCPLAECVVRDLTPPKRPSKPRVERNRGRTVVLSWKQASPGDGVAEYIVYNNGKRLTRPKPRFSMTSKRVRVTLRKLHWRRLMRIQVRAKDAAGNLSKPSKTVKFRVRR